VLTDHAAQTLPDGPLRQGFQALCYAIIHKAPQTIEQCPTPTMNRTSFSRYADAIKGVFLCIKDHNPNLPVNLPDPVLCRMFDESQIEAVMNSQYDVVVGMLLRGDFTKVLQHALTDKPVQQFLYNEVMKQKRVLNDDDNTLFFNLLNTSNDWNDSLYKPKNFPFEVLWRGHTDLLTGSAQKNDQFRAAILENMPLFDKHQYDDFIAKATKYFVCVKCTPEACQKGYSRDKLFWENKCIAINSLNRAVLTAQIIKDFSKAVHVTAGDYVQVVDLVDTREDTLEDSTPEYYKCAHRYHRSLMRLPFIHERTDAYIAAWAWGNAVGRKWLNPGAKTVPKKLQIWLSLIPVILLRWKPVGTCNVAYEDTTYVESLLEAMDEMLAIKTDQLSLDDSVVQAWCGDAYKTINGMDLRKMFRKTCPDLAFHPICAAYHKNGDNDQYVDPRWRQLLQQFVYVTDPGSDFKTWENKFSERVKDHVATCAMTNVRIAFQKRAQHKHVQFYLEDAFDVQLPLSPTPGKTMIGLAAESMRMDNDEMKDDEINEDEMNDDEMKNDEMKASLVHAIVHVLMAKLADMYSDELQNEFAKAVIKHVLEKQFIVPVEFSGGELFFDGCLVSMMDHDEQMGNPKTPRIAWPACSRG
jgi:hypothetical protein